MHRSKTLLAAILVLGAFGSSPAWAHDLTPPPWRGQEGSTFQVWGFSGPADPAAPDEIRNPYGIATADITVGQYGSGWLQQLPAMGSPTGYWDLGSNGRIVIDIDNRDEPLPYKEIWVQVTYYKDINQAPSVSVPGASYLGGQTLTVESIPTGGGWFLDLSKWRIEPNPSYEQILVTSSPLGSVVDQIVIDTICVPEPAMLGLLSLGGWAALAGRRRGRRRATNRSCCV
jgi:hypothetical protein